MKKEKNAYCGNCGKSGHMYRRCTEPITSLGVICYNNFNNVKNYLMIRRRDTLGFVEFMRGKYNLDNVNYIYKIFGIMTKNERQRILANNFDDLWNKLWMNKNTKQYHNEYENSKRKFIKIQKGFNLSDSVLTFKSINDYVECIYYEPEWGFPKGRRDLYESDIDCAMREFEEESGLTRSEYKILNMDPVEEVFLGSNNIRYKHIYYLAQYNGKINNDFVIDKTNLTQAAEVSNIQWFNLNDALEKIRPYNNEKKILLKQVHGMLNSLVVC